MRKISICLQMISYFLIFNDKFKVFILVIQMEQIKEWKQQNRNISRRIQAFEKQIPKMFPFNNTTDIKTKIQKLFQQEHVANRQQNLQQNQVFHKLKDINTNINQLKQDLKFYQKKNQYLVKIQNLSENIVNKIQLFKSTMADKYDQCADLQDQYTNQLELFQHRINLYQNNQDVKQQPNGQVKGKQNKIGNKQQQNIVKKQVKIDNFVNKANNNYEERIKKYDEQLKNKTSEMEKIQYNIRILGKNYGWPEQDHIDFVNIWNKRRGNNYFELQEECIKYFKLYTDQQIHDHIQRHKRYLELLEEKKQVLHEYKLIKEQKRDTQLKMLQRQEQQNQKKKQKYNRQIQKQKEQKQRKQRLQQWKVMKQTKKQIQQIRKKQQQHKKAQLLRAKQRQIQQKRMLVQQWKKQQQQKKSQVKQSNVKIKQSIDKQTLQKIRQRQDNMIMKKIELVKTKQLQQLQKIKKQQQNKQKKYIKYNYINSKLQQKTTAIKQKQRHKFDGKNPKQANTFGGRIGFSQSKAIPSWRQAL